MGPLDQIPGVLRRRTYMHESCGPLAALTWYVAKGSTELPHLTSMRRWGELHPQVPASPARDQGTRDLQRMLRTFHASFAIHGI